MKVLIGCEESQVVCKAFRERGHEAYSCDIIDCSGGHPEWHIKDDVLRHLEDGWDMMIGHPPCTHLAVSGAVHWKKKQLDGRQQKAIEFFMKMINAPIEKIAIENPIGIMSTYYRKPDQIIHPYYFGDTIPKKTCLWLKNLPLLKWAKEDNLFENKTAKEPEYILYNSKKTKSGKSKYSIYGKLGKGHGKERSVTSLFLAKAMAEQWGEGYEFRGTLVFLYGA
jgi:hypothetical protein